MLRADINECKVVITIRKLYYKIHSKITISIALQSNDICLFMSINQIIYQLELLKSLPVAITAS